ncbi:unnamed protein product [Camellia sinensis]
MERVCEELDEAKAEIEKLRAEHKIKTQLSESLKRAHNEQLIKIQEANAKIQKQAQEIGEKADEISITKQMYEELKSSMSEKVAIIKNLSSGNIKLGINCDEKLRKWEEEKRELVAALDVANSKNMDQGQKLHAYTEELKGLKSLLSVSEKKFLEAEKRAKESKELRHRDDMLHKLEEENRKVQDQLKWKKEQFKHLEEAHEKLRGQFKASKKEWETEKSALLDEISALQTNLDSQTRIAEGLQSRLQMCNQALAHEESRRKCLEVQLSETKTCFDSVLVECEEAKSKIECLTDQRDKDIASLRDLLGTKDMIHKEMEYRVGRLEQENQELRLSVKELQEAQIQEAGSSSLSKLRNKLKRLEHIHKDCSKNLSAKEDEWSSKLEKMEVDLTHCRYELERKDTVIKELQTELESCHSSIMHLELQNEETSLMLFVLKSGILEARLKLSNEMCDMDLKNSEREEAVSLLKKLLEIKSAALVETQRNIEEDHEKLASLSSKLESLSLIEQQQLQLQDELDRHKEMLKESSECQLHLKEQALLMKSDSENSEREEKVSLLMKQLEIKSAALVEAQRTIEEDHEKMASLLSKLESLSLIEQQQLQLQDELERHKERLKESSECQLHLKEQALLMKSDSENSEREEKVSLLMKQLEIKSAALVEAQRTIEEDHEKMASLLSKIESLSLVERQQLQLQDELERHKETLKESSECQLHLKEQALLMKSDLENSEREEKVSLLMKQLEIKSAALVEAQRNIEEDHEKMASLMSKIESSSLIEQQQLQLQDELERHKEMLKESSECQLHLKEQALLMKSDLENSEREEKVSFLMKQLEIKSAALVEAQRNIEEDHEKMAFLLSKIESLRLIEQQQLQLQDELERHKEMLKESSECQLCLKEQALWMKSDLKKVHEALNRANDELAGKFCEGNELEFELQIWKSIAQRFKANLEENQRMRKEVEVSLLEEVEIEATLKQEKDSLGHALEEKDRRIDDLQRQLVFLDKKLKIRETGKEKKKIPNGLQKEIECLEQELMQRELEGAILAHINAERSYEHEKDNFLRLVEERDQRIDDLHRLFMSSPTTSFSTQLAEKQAELDLVHGAWEKIATSAVLKEMEIQEKTLVLTELEDDFSNLQKKLESHLSSSEEEGEEIATELKAKQLEIRKLTSVTDKLESENRILVEDVKKLLSNRDSLLDFMGSVTEKVSQFSVADKQLMRVWERIMQNFDNNGRGIDLKGNNDDDNLFDPLKENMNIHHSLTTKRVEATTDERSPLRALNN